MTVRFLDLARQTEALRLELEFAMARVLDAGVFVGGAEVEAFEHELATFCGAGYAVGVNSGTDALELALRGLGVGAGDEVVTVANTCVPTVCAIVATRRDAGARRRRPADDDARPGAARGGLQPTHPRDRPRAPLRPSRGHGRDPAVRPRPRPARGRRRRPGLRRPAFEPESRDVRRRGRLQLLPDQEPRRPRRCRRGRHEQPLGRRPRALPARLRRRLDAAAGPHATAGSTRSRRRCCARSCRSWTRGTRADASWRSATTRASPGSP